MRRSADFLTVRVSALLPAFGRIGWIGGNVCRSATYVNHEKTVHEIVSPVEEQSYKW
jgi:hypothetical protein